MCSVSIASLTLSIIDNMFVEQNNNIFSFFDTVLILNMSGRSFIPSVKVLEQEQSVDDELPAEDR